MDLDESTVTDIKGKTQRKYLNRLQRDYYRRDTMWVKHLCLQLPQEPRSKCHIDDMTPYMLLEWNHNKYMQKCIFSMSSIRDWSEGHFSTDFKKIMERVHASEKFQSARSKHEKEFEFDYLFHCFFDANNELFPNEDNRQRRVMCGPRSSEDPTQ